MLPVNDNSFGICSKENDLGVIFAASLINKSPLEPLNDQQLPGCIEP